MELEQKLKFMDKAKRALDDAKDNIFEAGCEISSSESKNIGVHGNPYKKLMELINQEIKAIESAQMLMRRQELEKTQKPITILAEAVEKKFFDTNGDLVKEETI